MTLKKGRKYKSDKKKHRRYFVEKADRRRVAQALANIDKDNADDIELSDESMVIDSESE